MSKFDYGTFCGGYDDFAVSKEKYTKEQAIELYCIEHGISKDTKIAITNAFVRHRVGWDEDNERCCGWWLEYKEHSRSCPVYAFHEVLEKIPRKLESEYEWIDVKGAANESRLCTLP